MRGSNVGCGQPSNATFYATHDEQNGSHFQLSPWYPNSGVQLSERGDLAALACSGVKQPEATDRYSHAERRHERENDLNGELAVLHSDFLAKAFDLNGHEVNPETLFLVVSRHGTKRCAVIGDFAAIGADFGAARDC